MAGARYRTVRDLDWTLLVLTAFICVLGIMQIYSATHNTIWEDAWWKQIIYVIAGTAVMYAVAKIDYQVLLTHVPVFYILSIASLLLTFVVGRQVFGSRRWIPLVGGFHLQVSEFVKLVIILVIARYITDVRKDRLDVIDLLKLGGLVGVPMLLVMRQPDLGTSLTYMPALVVGVFLAGLRWQYMVAITLIFLMILPIGWYFLKDYQKARLVTFMDPDEDPRGSGYQVIQSRIAVGNGGIWGRGVTQGTQTQLRFLPVPHTDFIFSAFAEEHGFVGVLVGLGLYLMLILQIVQNAQSAVDRSGMYICMGAAAMLLFHVLVNVGMVVGRMPVAGIPLPLMSAGGSNTLSTFMLLGLVHSVRLRRLTN
ncbi:MAG: rod shape-determining protein RodA [Bryobacterales bacterium]|nr:rod shape-determining protein RodA [Bryobacterales bacterium]MEB2363376.1 rod shape-determining protein RodA [Bryobacterales bacterium]